MIYKEIFRFMIEKKGNPMQLYPYLLLLFSVGVIILSFITWHFYHTFYAFVFEFFLGCGLLSGSILEFKKKKYSIYFLAISSFFLMIYYGIIFIHTFILLNGVLFILSFSLAWFYGKKCLKF